MTTNPRSSQAIRPTRGMITGTPGSDDCTQRRSAFLAKAATAVLLITVCFLLLRALPRQAPVAVSSASPDRLSVSESTSHSFSSSHAAAPFAHDSAAAHASSASRFTPPPLAAIDVSTPEGQRIKDLTAFYGAASHPDDRAALAAELAAVNSPGAVRQLLTLLAAEKDPLARRDLLYALATAEARQNAGADLAHALQTLFTLSAEPHERGLMLEVLSEAPTPEAVAFLRTQAAREEIDPYERLSACESLMRISALAPELLGEDEVQTLQERLRTEAQASEGEPEYQAQALMALGGRKEENREFFRQMQASAQDPNVRHLLAKLGQ